MNRRIIILWLPAVLWMAGIFILSSFPTLPEPPGLSGLDKLEHYIAYAALAVLVFRAVFLTWSDRSLTFISLIALLITAAYGISDEVHQNFVPSRCCELLDWIADVLGAATGILLSLIILRFFRARKAGARMKSLLGGETSEEERQRI